VGGATATLASDDPTVQILDATASVPALGAGGVAQAADPFRVRVPADAPDGHVAALRVTFSAPQSLCRAEAAATVRITRGSPSCPFEEEGLDADPGWAIDGPSDGWEFGPPLGTGGTGGPTAAHTGANVYGTNLDGAYGSTAGEFVLTTTPFDLQGCATRSCASGVG